MLGKEIQKKELQGHIFMTRTDQKILFTALAFLAVMIKDEKKTRMDETTKVRQFASCIETFCFETVGDAMLLPPLEAGTVQIDQLIERHIQELKRKENTNLSENREILIKLYDRLQQRKAQRLQRDFYVSATEEKLADLVLRLLDEEIEDAETLQ